MNKETRYFDHEKIVKIWFTIQYRIRSHKRRGLFLSKWLFIQFYALSFLETISILNTIPGYTEKLIKLVNLPIQKFNSTRQLENYSTFLKLGGPELYIFFLFMILGEIIVICFCFLCC